MYFQEIDVFENENGLIKDLQSLGSSKKLFQNNKGTKFLKYEPSQKLQIEEQLKDQINKEIYQQNKIATQEDVYISILSFTFLREKNNILVYMKILIKVEKYSTTQLSQDSWQEGCIQEKMQLFSDFLKFSIGLEDENSKINLIQKNYVIYSNDNFFITMLGYSEKLQGNDQDILNKLKQYNNKDVNLDYKDEQDERKQIIIKNYRLDIARFIFKNFLNQKDSEEVSIKKILSSEFQIIQGSLKDILFSNKSLLVIKWDFEILMNQVQQQLKSYQQLSNSFQQWLNKLNKGGLLQQFLDEINQEQCLNNTLNIEILRLLSKKEITQYIEKLKQIQQNVNSPQKEKTFHYIQQANFRLDALQLLENQIQNPEPNLIYYLNEEELQDLVKKDKTSFKRLFQNDEQNVRDMINNYLLILQKMQEGNQQDLKVEDYKFIPMKYYENNEKEEIKKLYIKKKEEMKNYYNIEIFEFDKVLIAKDKYNQFMLKSNLNYEEKYFSEDKQLKYRLKSNQFKLLDKQSKETYIKQFLQEIKVIQEQLKSKQQQSVEKYKLLLQEYLDALNQNYEKITVNDANKSYSLFMYKDDDDIQILDIGMNYLPSSFELSKKLKNFWDSRFQGNIFIDASYHQFIRDFGYSRIGSNYVGQQIQNLPHGLGVRKLNDNHLKIGIFQLNQLIWGWEIKLQNNILIFYKGTFLNEEKSGFGIQQKFQYSTDKPILIEQYEGQFLDNQRNELGKLCKTGNQKVEQKGYFKNDELNGFGMEYEQENVKQYIYIGEFQKGKYHGNGKLFKQGNIIIGKFENGIHIPDNASRFCFIF